MPASGIEGLARRVMLVQAAVMVALALAWAGFGEYIDGLAAIYGGLVSMLLAWLYQRGVRKAERRAITDPKGGMRILYVGAVVRFGLLLALLGLGMGPLGLPALALLTGFVLVQLGFLAGLRL